MSSRLDKKSFLYLKLWDKVGIRIKKLVVLAFIFTIIIQSIINYNIDLLPHNTTIELEGKAVIESYYYESKGMLTITSENVEDIDSIRVFINGEQNQNRNNNYIELNVRNNDIIEIDGIGSLRHINLIIEEVSENVVFPKKGMKYKIEDNIVTLGRVKLNETSLSGGFNPR